MCIPFELWLVPVEAGFVDSWAAWVYKPESHMFQHRMPQSCVQYTMWQVIIYAKRSNKSTEPIAS